MNTFGKIFRLTTFGESHGKAMGAVIDGCPSGISLDESYIQKELDRRKPGQSSITTQRKEGDNAEILSGVFGGKTTGAPIAVIVFNRDQKSEDYSSIKDVFRPGHADEAWLSKFGIRDYRGGGRASGRETISRVIGGAIAKKILPKETRIIGHTFQVYNVKAEIFDESVIEKNPIRCADEEAAKKMEEVILRAKEEGDSVGGIAEIRIQNCPKNIGDPVFGKLKAKLADALFSIGTVFAVEILPGNDFVEMKGAQANRFSSGISGGISTGEDIIIRCVIKPTSSISKIQKMKTIGGGEKEVSIEGRHDSCIIPRFIPVAESMVALVLADLYLLNKVVRI